MDIEQQAYRSIVDLRQNVAARDIGLERARELAREEGDGSTAAVVDQLRAAQLETVPTGVHRERVDEALALVADEEFAAAGDLLREHYESVCERRDPELGDGPNPKACHLYDDAAAGTAPDPAAGANTGSADD
jgi:peptide/nickel transport system ATP-binding protein